MEFEDIAVDIGDGLGRITLAKPTVRPQSLQEICRAMDALAADDAVRAIILAGSGKHFSAGADFAFLDDLTRMEAPQIRKQVYTHFQGAARRLYTCPKPTIALVHGAAVTVGCELALACDFRIVARGAFFQESWVKLGIMPPLGGLFLLPRYIGLGRALDMALRGTRLEAEAALTAGLASELVEPEELAARGAALAAELADIAPLAYAAIKEALHRGLETGMEVEWTANVSTQSTLLRSNDFAEALSAIKEKRAPAFKGS